MVVTSDAQKGARSFKSSVTEMYLLPTDVYHRLVNSISSTSERAKIASINNRHSPEQNETSMPPPPPPPPPSPSHSSGTTTTSLTGGDLSQFNGANGGAADSNLDFSMDSDSFEPPLSSTTVQDMSQGEEEGEVHVNATPTVAPPPPPPNRKLPPMTIYICPVCKAAFHTKLSMLKHRLKAHSAPVSLENTPPASVTAPPAPAPPLAVTEPKSRPQVQFVPDGNEQIGDMIVGNQEELQPAPPPPSLPNNNNDNNEPKYFCVVCKRKFKTRPGLMLHMIKFHGGNRQLMDGATGEHSGQQQQQEKGSQLKKVPAKKRKKPVTSYSVPKYRQLAKDTTTGSTKTRSSRPRLGKRHHETFEDWLESPYSRKKTTKVTEAKKVKN